MSGIKDPPSLMDAKHKQKKQHMYSNVLRITE